MFWSKTEKFLYFSIDFHYFPLKNMILHGQEPGKSAQGLPWRNFGSLFFKDFYDFCMLEVICLYSTIQSILASIWR